MSYAEKVIELHYQNSISCANDLETVSEEVRKISSPEIADLIESLRTSWEGDSAADALGKIVQLQEDVTTDADNLKKTADVIRQMADAIRNAERRAYELIMKRKY